MRTKILIVILFIVVCFAITTPVITNEVESNNIETPKVEKITPIKIPEKDISKVDIVKKIASTFPENKVTMVAIALEESNLNPKAIGYNCYYKKGGNTFDTLIKTNIDLSSVSKTRTDGYVSTFCRKGHEQFAWSKDGGIMGINKASSQEMTVSGNINKAKKIYDTQGINAWVSYRTGRYKENLSEAKRLLNYI